MSISKKFIENPEFIESYLYDAPGMFNSEYLDEEIIEEIFLLSVEEFPESIQKISKNLLNTIKNIKNGKYAEARKCLGIRDDYVIYSCDIGSLRYWIKSWLYGLIVAKGGSWVEIKRLQENKIKVLKDPIDPLYEKLARNIPYSEVLDAIFRVKTNSDLQSFNNMFEGYILELNFNLSDLFIRKGQFSLEILSAEIQFEEGCKASARYLNLFKKEIDELRNFPLQKMFI